MVCKYANFLLPFLLLRSISLVSPSENYDYAITRYGRLRGKVKRVLGKELSIFSGVRFAKPPVDELRFKPPQEPESWTGTVDALSLSRACIQPPDETFEGFWGANMWNPNTPQDEDCLFLNIWAPRDLQNGTVMVWFFGGGFYYGSPSLDVYNAEGLAMEGNVVVVSPNYRVGAFGFLYLGTETVPGNMGLLDQRLALKWIKQNIYAFGGDPNKVSLFGESAGAASVVAHMISEKSKNMFNYGILQSGSLQNPWAMDTPERALNKSRMLVKELGCPLDYESETLECLLALPAKDYADNLWNIYQELYFMEFPLVIVSKDANFFDEIDAFEAIRKGKFKKTNLIIGIMADEGTFWLVYFLSKYFKTAKHLPAPKLNQEEFLDAINKTLDREPLVFRKAAAFHYGHSRFGNHCSTVRTEAFASAINQLVGDYEFTCDALFVGDYLTKNQGASVWLYFFNYVISSNPWPPWMGAMHGYEVEFVFGIPLINATHTMGRYTPDELKMTKQITKLWTTFAREGYVLLNASADFTPF